MALMDQAAAPETVWKRIMRFLLVATIYFVSDRAGSLMANPQTHISPVWPASGACIAALYFYGIRMWPAVFGGALLASAWTPGMGWEIIPFSAGNCIEAVLGAFVLRLAFKHLRLRRNLREALAVLVTAVIAPAADCVLGALALKFFLGQSSQDFWSSLLSWWAGDTIGVLTVLPAVLAFHRCFSGERLISKSALFIRAAGLGAGAVVISILVFWSPWGGTALFLLFPILLLAAVVIGPAGANTTAFVLVSLGTWSTCLSHGPFVSGSLDQNLLQLDLFAVSVPLAAMLLSVLAEEGSLLWPGVVLLAGWALSGCLFASLNNHRLAFDEAQMKRLETSASSTIQDRMATYMEALIGTASYLSVSGQIDSAQWKSWVNSQQILERHPGLRGIGIAEVVREEQVAAYLRDARTRISPDFEIKNVPGSSPPKSRPFHCFVSLLEPISKRQLALGLDLSSEKNRLAAVLAAASSGNPSMSAHISLVQDLNHRNGFLILLPIYRPGMPLDTAQERINAVTRFVYAPFLTESFFEGVLDHLGGQIDFDVFEGDSSQPESWIFGLQGSPRKHFEAVTHVTIEGRPLTFGWNRGANFTAQQNTAAIWASACSAALSLLLACLVTSLQSVSVRANLIAAERTAALAASRDELAEALRAADAASEAKSDFLAVMSHEIRTPLNGILGMNALLCQTKLSVEQNEYAHAIQLSGEGLLTLINDILDFSKIETRQLTLESQPFSLKQCVNECVTLLAPRAAAKELELTYKNDQKIPDFVSGDLGRLRQVLLNLIGNAIKFTASGSVRVYANCLEMTEAYCTISVAVEDTGIGISKPAQAKLFERFSQVDATTRRRYGGTGLGLAICKNLVELMGGQLTVESLEGKGSTFTFSLKLPVCAAAPPGWKPLSRLAQSRILVIDEGLAETKDLVQYLQRVGLRHQSARTQEDALKSLREARLSEDSYDVVLVSDPIPASLLALSRAIDADTSAKKTALIVIRNRPSADLLPDHGPNMEVIDGPVESAKVFDALSRAVGQRQHTETTTPEPSTIQFEATSRILVAEDNPVNQKVLSRLLQKLGLSADIASNGRQAVEMWRTGNYSLILMDCQMPEMDGYEATRLIRASESKGTHIPIIAVTANALVGDREKCIASGMDGFVPKPIKTELLLKAVEESLRASA